MKNMPILVKREIWEHPAFYIAPAIVFGLSALGLLLGAIQLDFEGIRVNTDGIISHLNEIPFDARESALALAYIGVAFLFMAVMPFVVFFYLIDTLYAERKERHILFWKSLPATDTETVLSKVFSATVVIPLVTAFFILITYIFFLLVGSFELPGEVKVLDLIWKPAPIFKMFLTSVYAFLAMALWMLPFAGWFLLSGSLFKRIHPFIVAIVTPVLIIMVEGMLFNSTYFADWIGERFVNWIPEAFDGITENGSFDFDFDGDTIEGGDVRPWQFIAPLKFLASARLWLGFVVGSIFIGAAIYLRRFRDDS